LGEVARQLEHVTQPLTQLKQQPDDEQSQQIATFITELQQAVEQAEK
jgi:hypothetical protein